MTVESVVHGRVERTENEETDARDVHAQQAGMMMIRYAVEPVVGEWGSKGVDGRHGIDDVGGRVIGTAELQDEEHLEQDVHKVETTDQRCPNVTVRTEEKKGERKQKMQCQWRFVP